MFTSHSNSFPTVVIILGGVWGGCCEVVGLKFVFSSRKGEKCERVRVLATDRGSLVGALLSSRPSPPLKQLSLAPKIKFFPSLHSNDDISSQSISIKVKVKSESKAASTQSKKNWQTWAHRARTVAQSWSLFRARVRVNSFPMCDCLMNREEDGFAGQSLLVCAWDSLNLSFVPVSCN